MSVIVNRRRTTQYYDVLRGVVLTRENALEGRGWAERLRAASLDDHVANGVPPVTRPNRYRSVAGFVPIPPRSRWDLANGAFTGGGVVEAPWRLREVALGDIEDVARQYIALTGRQRIVVELSGGLDSSMVANVLLAVGADVALVGFVFDHFEFRTERAIQQLFIDSPTPTVSLDTDDALPFSRLSETPLHVVPTVPALFHVQHTAIATAAAAQGARTVLSGVGGDALCCDAFDGDAAMHLPLSHHGWGLYDAWPHDHVYAPRGMAYVAAFAVWPIPHLVWAMRRGQPEDVQKRFARGVFEGRLPRELTRFAYKADHGGPFFDGLEAGRAEIAEVARSAWEVTRHEVLRPERVLGAVDRAIHLDDKAMKHMLSTLSFATWIHGFVREGLV